jgi:protein-S-isoprenylcysteine O-methyltransferase Ste14
MPDYIGKAVFLFVVAAWYGIRLPHLIRSRSTPVLVSRRGPLERALMAISGAGMGFIPFAYVAFGFGGFGDRPQGTAAILVGSTLALASLAMFRLSHAALGRQWSVSLELRSRHELQTTGVYRYVRHPMYVAFWLWCVAQAFLLPNWIAGLSGALGFGCLYTFRVRREETMMVEHYGDRYRDYASRTPRLIPRIFAPGRA